MTKSIKELKFYGMPVWFAVVAILVVYIATMLEVLSTDIVGVLALMIAIAIPLNELGKRIPIWNKYVGGGLILTFLGTAALVQFNILPTKYAEAIDTFTSDTNFLTFFIITLIAGSILSLERNLMIKSFSRYIPAILGGLIGAALLGILGGLLFEITPQRILIAYVLPIMGGGNGGGAVPLSQIWEGITGEPSTSYYSFAIIILTIANIFAILSGALLDSIGNKNKSLTGDKRTLIRSDHDTFMEKEEEYKPSHIEIGSGLFFGVAAFAFGRIMSNYVLPEILGAPIHQLAYMIIFVVLVSALDLVPRSVRAGARVLQKYTTTTLTIAIMVGVGVDMDLQEFLNALTFGNVVIALLIVIGAILGSALVGYWVGFYPVDSAVTAGLCMANRGGSGDIAVLGAANRMELMAYAQLSSRLGGAIVLIIGSFIFSFLA